MQQQKIDTGLILDARRKLAHLVRDLESAGAMMDQAQQTGAADSKCAIAWGAAILTLDVARNFLSKDPTLGAMFTGTDFAIGAANKLLKHYRKVPLMVKDDLLQALPPELRLVAKPADYTKTVLGGLGNAPKVIPGALKGIDMIQKKVPGIAYVLNTPVLKGQLTQFQKQLKPFMKTVPANMGFVVGLLTDVMQDGALTLDAYNGYDRNKTDGDATIKKVNILISKQRRKLLEMDQNIMQMLHSADYRKTLA